MSQSTPWRAAAAAQAPTPALSSRLRGQQRRHVTCHSARTAVTSTQQPAISTPRLQRHERLQDPAQIGARGTATVNVKDIGHAATATGEDVSLDTYMRLPVEQYYILDPQQIQFLSGNKFILSVPRIQLLGASLEPVIEVQVTSEQDAVLLQATDCQLNATGIMGGLDSKFALQFQTRLTWHSHTHGHLAKQQHQQPQQLHVLPQPHVQQQQQQQPGETHRSGAVPSHNSSSSNGSGSTIAGTAHAHLKTGWNRLRSVGWPSSNGHGSSNARSAGPGQQAATPGSITGSALVQVWCEVVPPFHLMPREVLERSCNLVISGLVNSLLPWFMRQLAADYQKWAADESYRAARRLRTTQKKIG